MSRRDPDAPSRRHDLALAASAASGVAPLAAPVAQASFPSGRRHATSVTASSLVIVYILRRKELASPTVLAALLLLPVLCGVTLVYRGRRWFSDVLPGWIAGIGVASRSVIFC